MISDKEKLELLESLKEFCSLIGCSGLSSNCPGNPNCKIVRKVFNGRADQVPCCEDVNVQ